MGEPKRIEVTTCWECPYRRTQSAWGVSSRCDAWEDAGQLTIPMVGPPPQCCPARGDGAIVVVVDVKDETEGQDDGTTRATP